MPGILAQLGSTVTANRSSLQCAWGWEMLQSAHVSHFHVLPGGEELSQLPGGAPWVGRGAPAGTLCLVWDGTASGPSHQSLFPLASLSDELFATAMQAAPARAPGALLSSWPCCCQARRVHGPALCPPSSPLVPDCPGPQPCAAAAQLLDILSDLRGRKSRSVSADFLIQCNLFISRLRTA